MLGTIGIRGLRLWHKKRPATSTLLLGFPASWPCQTDCGFRSTAGNRRTGKRSARTFLSDGAAVQTSWQSRNNGNSCYLMKILVQILSKIEKIMSCLYNQNVSSTSFQISQVEDLSLHHLSWWGITIFNLTISIRSKTFRFWSFENDFGAAFFRFWAQNRQLQNSAQTSLSFEMIGDSMSASSAMS